MTEKEFQRLLGGEKKSFEVVVNGKKKRRNIDNFLENTAREIKSGPLKNDGFIREQIEKDIQLIKQKNINIEWHLFEGGDEDLIEFMEKNGIKVIRYDI